MTMAYNESALLPIWARHYARQVGADHCYVVDHGSTEAYRLPAGVNTLRIPRSPHDDERRARFISELATSLLQYYDWVVHVDVDELILADPHQFSDLTTFCAASTLDTVSAIGFDVQHVPAMEAPLDLESPLGQQRQWVRFTSAMCKPVLTRQPIAWSPGFHCSNQPLSFAPLYLFHLHWADRDLGLRRLKKTRDMAWAKGDFGAHQRVADRDWSDLFDAMAALPRTDPVAFDPATAPIYDWLKRTVESGIGREHETYTFDLHVNAGELWSIPPHFRARL
jgi:hypothetical protein